MPMNGLYSPFYSDSAVAESILNFVVGPDPASLAQKIGPGAGISLPSGPALGCIVLDSAT